MSPELDHGLSSTELIVTKFGGSLFFKLNQPNIDPYHVNLIIRTLRAQKEQGHPILAVVGGGTFARTFRDTAIQFGIKDKDQLDRFGISGTEFTAKLLVGSLEAKGVSAVVFDAASPLYQQDAITVRGGSVPGQTTDTVLVSSGIATQREFVIKISRQPLLARTENGTLLNDEIVSEIPLSVYLKTIAEKHKPGIHTPLDKPAAILALQSHMEVVMLGMEMKDPVKNIMRCINGEPFQGTRFLPR